MLILTIENGLRFSCRSFLCTFSVFCVTWSCLHKKKYIEISRYRVSLIHWGNFWQIKSSPVSQCPAVAPSHVQIFSQISQEDFSGTQPPRRVLILYVFIRVAVDLYTDKILKNVCCAVLMVTV